MNQHNQQKGFTLLELLVSIAIVGILLALAAPNFTNMLARNAVRDVVSEWQESFYYAQSEAMRLQNNVLLCASTDGATCDGNNFKQGWIVIEQGQNKILRDVPGSTSADLTITSEKGLHEYSINGAGRLPNSFVGDTLTFLLERNGKEIYKRELVINTEGRIR